MKTTILRRACLSLLLLMGMTVNISSANYPLYVCGLPITDANRQNLSQMLTMMGYLKSGTVEFDGKRTITLCNVQMEFHGVNTENPLGAAVFMNVTMDSSGDGELPGIDDLTFVVEGDNKITGGTDAGVCVFLANISDRVVFKGSGKLDVSFLRTSTVSTVKPNNCGIVAYGNVSFLSGEYKFNCSDLGILCYKGNIFFGGGDVTLMGGMAAVSYEGDESTEPPVLSPFAKYNLINDVQLVSEGEEERLADASGNVLKSVRVIEQDKSIYLFVGGTQVTRQNKDDVLGDGGSVTFDGKTLTLTDAHIGTLNQYDVKAFNMDEYGTVNGMENIQVKLVGENTTSGDGWNLYRGTKIYGDPYISKRPNATMASLKAVGRWGYHFIDNLTVSDCSLDLESQLGSCLSGYTEEAFRVDASGSEGILHVNNAYVKAHCQRQQNGYYPMAKLVVDASEGCDVLCPAGYSGDNVQYFWDGSVIIGNCGETYPLSVCGIQLCEGNIPYLNEGLRGLLWLTEGSVSFDPAAKTLTLNNANLNYRVYNGDKQVAVIMNLEKGTNSAIDGLNIVLNGDNHISFTNAAVGIASYGEMNLCNNGTLTITGDDEDETAGIESIAKVTFTGGNYAVSNVEKALLCGEVVINSGRYDLNAFYAGLCVGSRLIAYSTPRFTLGPGLEITKPVPYDWKSDDYTHYIIDHDRNIAPHVMISDISVATQVKNAVAEQTIPTWNTLGGQRINKPTQKGIYLMNGKKVVVK